MSSNGRRPIWTDNLNKFDPGLLSPPSSQLGMNDDASNLFISPPPEETLRPSSRHSVSFQILLCLYVSPSHALVIPWKVHFYAIEVAAFTFKFIAF
jgi:hypothetical protein